MGVVRDSTGYVVRFHVLESFLNAVPGDDFATQLTSDLYVNSAPQGLPSFAAGTTWLVEARRRNPDQPWTTGLCTRTKLVSRADEDLRVLRHWAVGDTLPAVVTGEVWDPKVRKDIPGISLRLSGGNRTLSIVSDAQGHFAFEAVEPGVYQLEALLPSGTVTQPVDLVHAWCAYSVIGPR